MDGLEKLKQAMSETGAKTGADLEKAGKPRRCLGNKKNIAAAPMDPQTGQGPNFQTQVHAVQMAEVEVNTETGEVRVVKVTTAVDAGTVINPQNLTGQLEGGMDMGVGYALREEYIAAKPTIGAASSSPPWKPPLIWRCWFWKRPAPPGPWAPPVWARCAWCPRPRRCSTPWTTLLGCASPICRPRRTRCWPPWGGGRARR